MEGSRCRAGLIETDLDTEVTVITSNAAGGAGNAAAPMTRSLLDLGPTRSHQRTGVGLTAPDGTVVQDSGARPHKSMEFLLDKQNLKVVEVSNS